MDESQFDGIARALGATTARRGALGLLAALGAGGVVGSFGAFAKGKGKGKKKKGKKSGPKRPCPVKAKPACATSACYAPSCDNPQGKWSCRNVCAGTSTPKCLGGQCVDACDEALGLTECGDQCCNPLVHSECCQGTCCALGQRCEGGKCVPRCGRWESVRGGRLDYTITFWARTDEIRGNYHELLQADQTAAASAELTCSYDAVWGLVDCENLGGTITGTHALHRVTTHATTGSTIYTRDEQGSGDEDLPAGSWPDVGPHLEFRLHNGGANPATYEVNLVTIEVEGTWQESPGQSGTAAYWIPGLDELGFWSSDPQPLPATPLPLSRIIEWEVPSWLGQNLARFTWTFTPDAC